MASRFGRGAGGAPATRPLPGRVENRVGVNRGIHVGALLLVRWIEGPAFRSTRGAVFVVGIVRDDVLDLERIAVAAFAQLAEEYAALDAFDCGCGPRRHCSAAAARRPARLATSPSVISNSSRIAVRVRRACVTPCSILRVQLGSSLVALGSGPRANISASGVVSGLRQDDQQSKRSGRVLIVYWAEMAGMSRGPSRFSSAIVLRLSKSEVEARDRRERVLQRRRAFGESATRRVSRSVRAARRRPPGHRRRRARGRLRKSR